MMQLNKYLKAFIGDITTTGDGDLKPLLAAYLENDYEINDDVMRELETFCADDKVTDSFSSAYIDLLREFRSLPVDGYVTITIVEEALHELEALGFDWEFK